ncbi:MAG: hypothetical protein KatS3mg077_1682 [Candidatus Binatia bacterium]|nr:MAG: hypothetical protein KatS3mg077_1682 [Candidatus Binatia bacterium]
MDLRLRQFSYRLLLLAFGFSLALVTAEALLRLGAWYVRRTHAAQTLLLRPGAQIRILTLGDSNTYGFGVGRERAYPAVLERLWNDRVKNPTVQAFNLGFPGTNSSQIAAELDRMLAAFHPDVVTVMVGANDPWTVPVPVNQNVPAAERIQLFLWRTSRVYRLLYMLSRAWDNASLDVEVREGSNIAQGSGTARYGRHHFHLGHKVAESPPPDWQVRLETNLRRIAAGVRASGAKLYLVTYPSDSHLLYGYANAVMRRIAVETGSALVDVAAQMPPACSSGRCPELLPDHHPSEQGHIRTAEILLARLQEHFSASAKSSPANP